MPLRPFSSTAGLLLGFCGLTLALDVRDRGYLGRYIGAALDGKCAVFARGCAVVEELLAREIVVVFREAARACIGGDDEISSIIGVLARVDDPSLSSLSELGICTLFRFLRFAGGAISPRTLREITCLMAT